MGLEAGANIGTAIEDMTRRLGLPTRLSEIGVDESLFAGIVEGALHDHSHKTNPREASSADYLSMLEQSL